MPALNVSCSFRKNKGNAPVTKPGGDSAHIRHIPAKAIDGMNQKRITVGVIAPEFL
ncbi:hypothetical protein MY011_48330 [Escherichia coli]|nr:hypothetical protein MY011_48330 [Escherichia coli]